MIKPSVLGDYKFANFECGQAEERLAGRNWQLRTQRSYHKVCINAVWEAH